MTKFTVVGLTRSCCVLVWLQKSGSARRLDRCGHLEASRLSVARGCGSAAEAFP